MRWPLAWGALALLLASLPYALAWWGAPPGSEFTGLLVHLPDGFSYLAKMRQGWEGAWLFRLPYCVESSDPAPLFFFHLLLGHLARLLDAPLILVYHTARILAGAALLWAFWDLLRFLCPDERSRRAGYALGCLGSGLGWLLLPSGVIAPDLSIPEANIFFSLFANPHFPAALAAFAGALSCGFRALDQRATGWTVAAAFCALTAGVIHPFLAAPLGGLLALAALWPPSSNAGGRESPRDAGRTPMAQRAARAVLIAGAAALPAAVQTAALAADPSLAAWTAQNRTLSPNPLAMAIGYGAPGLLALLGAWTTISMQRKPGTGAALEPARPADHGWRAAWRGHLGRRETWPLPVIWLIAGAALLYFPVAFQRRFAEGLQFPLMALAGAGVTALAGGGPGRRRLLALLLALSLPTTALNLAVPVLGSARRVEPVYLSAADRAAYDWLAANAARADVVLAGPLHGNQLPAYTPVRVVWGHEFETLDSAARLAAVRRFFSGDQSVETADFLRRQGVTLLFLGKEEAQHGAPAPAYLAGAHEVYRSNGVRVLRLPPP